MRRLWGKGGFAVLISLGLLGCTSDELLTPDAAEPARSQGSSYTLIEDRLSPDLATLSVSRIIGLEGGRVELAGHSIVVPAGAVSEPAIFSIRLLTTGYVEVDLTALHPVSFIDVGSKGFARNVTLTLTYARSPNVADPARLLILRNLGTGHTGPFQVMPSRVNLLQKTVEAELDHFSSYVMASG